MFVKFADYPNFDFYRDYEWCDQEGEEEGRMEGKKCTGHG